MTLPINLSNYCTIEDIRNEGFSESDYPNSRVEFLIGLASRYIDKMTGRWFYPREFKDPNFYFADGAGRHELLFNIPIIRLDSAKIELQGFVTPSQLDIDLSSIRVYNRHLFGQTTSGDYQNSKISFIGVDELDPIVKTQSFLFGNAIFPVGRQNVIIEGVFGFTEYDGLVCKDENGNPLGKTPDLIRYACILIVGRELGLLATCNKTAGRTKHRIISEKGGTSTIKLQEDFLRGVYTGDPNIDQILVSYKRPIRLGAV